MSSFIFLCGTFAQTLAWICLFHCIIHSCPGAHGADVNIDDAATAETDDQVVRYTDRIRAYVNITFTDPVTGLRRSEKSLKGKWGTNGRMEQVIAPAHVAIYGGNKTDGCKKLDQPLPTGQWIAIIERGQCRFSDKIRNAIDANATAVIIYDNEPNKTPLFMHHDVENAVAIFITKEFGDRIVELIDNDTKVLVRITIGLEPSAYPRINRTSVLFVSISFIVLMIISLAWLIFYYIQRFRYAHAKDRLAKRLSQAAKKAITKIPIRTLKASDKEVDSETDACAICIDSFLVGEIVRVLPCQHIFHKSCVDPWLLEQRTCPMCKLDILKAYGLQVCPSQDSLSRIGGRSTRQLHILAESEEGLGLGYDNSRDDDLINGFSSEPSSAFRSSPRIVHIATSISAAGRLANAPPPSRNNNLTSRMDNFSRPRNMVCPRHGVSVGSCTHDVDITPEEISTPVKEEGAVGAANPEIILDRVEEFADVPLHEEAGDSPCKCSDEDDDVVVTSASVDDYEDDDDRVKNTSFLKADEKRREAKAEEKRRESEEERKSSTGLLTKEVLITPSLPGAPEDAPPTPPPAHPLTPETLIAGRTRSAFPGREPDTPSPSPSPSSLRAEAAETAGHRGSEVTVERRPPSVLSNISACNETTKLNGGGM